MPGAHKEMGFEIYVRGNGGVKGLLANAYANGNGNGHAKANGNGRVNGNGRLHANGHARMNGSRH
jgi:hypothetical protein